MGVHDESNAHNDDDDANDNVDFKMRRITLRRAGGRLHTLGVAKPIE
jgi:hypothetical protein